MKLNRWLTPLIGVLVSLAIFLMGTVMEVVIRKRKVS